MTFLRAHKGLALALAAIVAYVIYRKLTGQTLAGGHATPDDAISYGWVVYPAGITGWLEVSPDGKTQYLHSTGYTHDPYQAAEG